TEECEAFRKTLFRLHLQSVVNRIPARLLESDAAPPRVDAPVVDRSGAGRWLIDVAIGHQLIGFISDVGGFEQNARYLPLDCEIPLLAVGCREVKRAAVNGKQQI